MPAAVVCGLGAHLPERSISNRDLDSALDTSDAWIQQRTGIARRYWVAPGTSTSDLAVKAGAKAMESAECTSVDMVILATTTPDRPCPATAPEVAWRLGIEGRGAFDLSAVCSGFLYAMASASAYISAGIYQSVLVIGSEVYSSIVDPMDRTCSVIFGDGAGAVVMRAGDPEEPGALAALDLGSDGENADFIRIDAGGSRLPNHDKKASRIQQYFRMEGSLVYRHAVHRMTDTSRKTLKRAGWPASSIEAFVGHQANQRILDSVADRLTIPLHRRHGNIRNVGNTAAASIPLAMADANEQKVIQPGSRTLLTAFGGGLTWSSIALTWPDVHLTQELVHS